MALTLLPTAHPGQKQQLSLQDQISEGLLVLFTLTQISSAP